MVITLQAGYSTCAATCGHFAVSTLWQFRMACDSCLSQLLWPLQLTNRVFMTVVYCLDAVRGMFLWCFALDHLIWMLGGFAMFTNVTSCLLMRSSYSVALCVTFSTAWASVQLAWICESTCAQCLALLFKYVRRPHLYGCLISLYPRHADLQLL